MTPRDAGGHVDLLIPWYVNGTLEREECARLEEHVACCPRCRGLLEQQRSMADAAGPESLEPPDHVPAALLVRYVEAPRSLPRETRQWIERSVFDCESCREALARLRALEARTSPAASDSHERPGGLARNLWASLVGSILRPVPALAYLVLVALLLPLVWLRGPGRDPGEGAPLRTPVLVETAGESATRQGQAAPTALELSVESGALVLLRLRTELEGADLADPDLGFALQLERGSRVLWSEPRATADFLLEDGRGVMPVLLDPARLQAGEVYRVVLRTRKPGDPLDGQALFQRSVVWIPKNEP